MQYWGFDLGDGESAVARVGSGENRVPEIVDIDGKKVVITVWAVMPNGEVRIGDNAARSAAAAVRSAARFKRRFLDAQSDCAALIRDFSARVFESLRGSGALVGGEKSNSVYVGCPAGWDADARERYERIFETLGFPSPKVVSESRAVMVGAIQSNSVRDHVDLRTKSVLVIDIGSSTTDFAYIDKGKEQEIHTGGEVALGGGIMDEVLLNECVASSPNAAALKRVMSESESWRVDCELRARRLKERYYSLAPEDREKTDCSESLLITWDEPLILDLRLDGEISRRLTDRPCPQLGGRSWRDVFCDGLRQVRASIGSAPPELLFLTGGVSRMEEIRRWCREVFPEAIIYTDAEPEFSVARGLAWCGRIDDDLARFREDVNELIESSAVENIISRHLNDLYRSALEHLIDPLMNEAVKPLLIDWKTGKIRLLKEMEEQLRDRIRVYLFSDSAKECLYQPITDWLLEVSGELEEQTSRICRKYHVPERSLGISSALSASDFSMLEQVDARGVLSGESLTWTTVFVDSVISIIVALLCGGSGIVLISEGPAGMLIGFVLSFLLLAISHVMGKKAIDDRLMNMDLPLVVRRIALSGSLLQIEGPRLGSFRPLSGLLGDGDNETKKGHLLPHVRFAERSDISEKRLQEIRSRIRSGYESVFSNPDSEELRSLNDRMSRDISHQIERRLKELAEQVEIPL